MSQSFFKSFFISILIITAPNLSYPETPQSCLDATSQDKGLAQKQYEEFEQKIGEARREIEQIGYALQQIILAIQAKKVTISPEKADSVLSDLEDIFFIKEFLLNQFFTQTNTDIPHVGLHLNNIVAKYLLKAVKTTFTSLDAQKLQRAINACVQKKVSDVTPESTALLIKKNQALIAELIQATDFIGLTWYNKSYRFLQNYHAYDITRAATVLIGTSLIAACVYKSCRPEAFHTDGNRSMAFFDSIIGSHSKYILDEGGRIQLGKNGKPLVDDGSGLLKVWENYKSLVAAGIVSPLGYSLPIKEFISGVYSQYWNNAKRSAIARWKKFDAICSGVEKKHSVHDCEKVYFDDMTGAEHLADLAKKITNYLQHPERYERTQMEEHRGILLHGPPQTGKTLFAKALKTMIDENLGSDKKMAFIDVKKILDIDKSATIDDIFYFAKSVAPCILFIDEIDIVGAHREKNPINAGQLLTNMQGLDMVTNKIFVIAATNRLEQIDKSLLVDGRFGKIIHIDYPNYEHRKLYLENELAKRSIKLAPDFINGIAQESNGASYNKLKRIITEALILSTLSLRPVTEADFEKSLDTEVRKIEKPTTNLSLQEKRIVATYQAGKALMKHLLHKDQNVVKVTILSVAKNVKTNEFGWAMKTDLAKQSDNDALAEEHKDAKSKNGEVFVTYAKNDRALLSDEENKKEAFCLLAGRVAHKIIFNELFSQCNPQDRADAMQIIQTIISQGEPIDKAVRAKALEIKAQYDAEIETILRNHKDVLEEIIEQLLKNTSIDRHQWQEIIKNCPKLV